MEQYQLPLHDGNWLFKIVKKVSPMIGKKYLGNPFRPREDQKKI